VNRREIFERAITKPALLAGFGESRQAFGELLAREIGISPKPAEPPPAETPATPLEAAIAQLSDADRELLKDPKNAAEFKSSFEAAQEKVSMERTRAENLAAIHEAHRTREHLQKLAQTAAQKAPPTEKE